MRDPKRIDRVLDRVRELWNIYPDQRLGQLLQNYVFGRGDNFYIEDDETERMLTLEIGRRGNLGKDGKKNLLQIVNKSNNPFPVYASKGDSGFDLRAFIETPIILEPMKRKVVPTGLYVSIPDGFELQIRPRSGLAAKQGIGMVNTPGTIDTYYRGEIGVIIINLGNEPFTINNGDRIAQAVLCPVSSEAFTELREVKELSNTERGAGGFGHTGTT